MRTLTDTDLAGRKIFVREVRPHVLRVAACTVKRCLVQDREAPGSTGPAPMRSTDGSADPGVEAGKIATEEGRKLFVEQVWEKPAHYFYLLLITTLTSRSLHAQLPFSLDWGSLKDHFSAAGPVVYTKVFTDTQGRSKGCGVVEFEDARDAKAAIRKLLGCC